MEISKNLTKPEVPVQRGRCILTEKPFVYGLKSKYRTERCDYCFAEGKVQKCSNCLYVYYCNRSCQKEAWPIHKLECSHLRKISPRILPDAARVLARIILKLNNGGDFEKSYYTKRDCRKFKDLMTHYKDLKEIPKRMEHVQSLYEVLKQTMGECLLPNETEFLCIYGRMVINTFNVLDMEMNSLGTGMYLGISITDHRCKPNAVVTFEGTTLFIRTLEDLPSLDWSNIFISYIDLLNSTDVRQSELQQNYFFLCDCVRCNDLIENVEMNAAACPNKNCSEYLKLDADTTECPKCETKIPDDYHSKYIETIEFTKMHLDAMKDVAYLDVCLVMLKRQTVFHPMNVWHVKTLEMTFEGAINIGKWDEAVKYGNELIVGLRKYCGDYNPILGLVYMKIGKILLFENHVKEAMRNLKQSSEIISVTHGQQHTLYKTQLLPLLIEASGST